MIRKEMWQTRNGRKYLHAGSWTWSEGAESEEKRDTFNIECSICEWKKKFRDREHAIKFSHSTERCPGCGIWMTCEDPW